MGLVTDRYRHVVVYGCTTCQEIWFEGRTRHGDYWLCSRGHKGTVLFYERPSHVRAMKHLKHQESPQEM